MYKIPHFAKSSIKSPNEPAIGETIEVRLERLITNGQPTADAQIGLHYTERHEGVKDAYNIRTDKWEIAVETANRIAESYQAREEQELKPAEEQEKGDGEPESV